MDRFEWKGPNEHVNTYPISDTCDMCGEEMRSVNEHEGQLFCRECWNEIAADLAVGVLV